jgi:hypothetical protein
VEEPRLITEPAWFYSSLAQATAGLIGLLGGVLILRLQQQSVAIQESRDRILTELSQLRTSATSMLQTATGFIEWVKDDIRAIEDALRSGATTREVSQECDPFGSSHSGQNESCGQNCKCEMNRAHGFEAYRTGAMRHEECFARMGHMV